MPIAFPGLNGTADSQEAYDEGLDDTVDADPYRLDDDPIKSTKRLMKMGIGSTEKYTTNHDIIHQWTDYRYGHPARIKGAENGLDKGSLYIHFEDDEPDIETEEIDWKKFFQIFEKNKLAFLYRTKTRSGAESYFYRFIDRRDIARITEAKEVKRD